MSTWPADWQEEPGWEGVFTRRQVPGALPNGSRIRKAVVEPGDLHPVGAQGTVLGSISHPALLGGEPAYFVEWDDRPRWALFVTGRKIAPLDAP